MHNFSHSKGFIKMCCYNNVLHWIGCITESEIWQLKYSWVPHYLIQKIDKKKQSDTNPDISSTFIFLPKHVPFHRSHHKWPKGNAIGRYL